MFTNAQMQFCSAVPSSVAATRIRHYNSVNTGGRAFLAAVRRLCTGVNVGEAARQNAQDPDTINKWPVDYHISMIGATSSRELETI